MLEERIRELISTIEELTRTIHSIGMCNAASEFKPESRSAETKTAETKTAETKTAETKPAETKTAETKPAETKTQTETPTAKLTEQDLVDLCLAIVRRNRMLKDRVKGIIADFGGALIKDVPEAKYPELKAALETL
jgi:TolA-binding protein